MTFKTIWIPPASSSDKLGKNKKKCVCKLTLANSIALLTPFLRDGSHFKLIGHDPQDDPLTAQELPARLLTCDVSPTKAPAHSIEFRVMSQTDLRMPNAAVMMLAYRAIVGSFR